MASSATERVIDWRTNNEKISKADFLKELNQMEVKCQKLEKERSAFLQARRADLTRDSALQLLELESTLGSGRRTDKLKLQQEIGKIRDLVRKFHAQVHDVKPTPQFVEKIKEEMEDIEACISRFKEVQKDRFEETQREERLLSQECHLLERKIEAWATGADGAGDSARPRPVRSEPGARDVTCDLPEEVAAFERFLAQTGGRLGGWDELDHQTFLRVRQQFRGREAFLDELLLLLPTRPPDQIRRHEDWYREFLVLRDKKKEAIARWRSSKAAAAAAAAPASDSGGEEDAEEARRRQEREERDREAQRAQLEAWRVQREVARQQEAARRLAEERGARRGEERRRQEREAARAELDAYREERARAEEERLALEMWRDLEEREARRTRCEQNSARINQRNERMAREKLSQKRRQEEAEKAKAKRLERLKATVEVNASRDPDRLTRPTAGWAERLKAAPEAGGQVLHMPHRAVPTWRQGV